MAVYLISYDLITPGQHYPKVHAAIKAISPGSWAKPLESLWLVPSNLSTNEVRDLVKTAMDKNDKLIVIEVTNDGVAGWNLPNDAWQWIQKNV